MRLDIRYDAPPTVGRMLRSNAFVRVIEGPLGSGKSSGCVMEIPRRALEQSPAPDGIRHTRFAIVRNTYRELEDTTRKTFEQWNPPQLGKWNEQDFAFRMKFKDVESEVLFRALDRPDDVKKLLSLELTGCYFNEIREIAKPIFDGMQGRVGRYPSKVMGGPDWFGVWADSNPWHTAHWLAKLFKHPPEGFELYRQPPGRSPLAENVENLPPGYYERLCLGKDEDWIRVYVDGEEASSDVGSIYGDLLDALERRGGVGRFEHPKDGIFTAWDLGFTDSTAIWFFRLADGGGEFVDFYEAHGQPLSHYVDVLRDKAASLGYQYAKHWLPHDAQARTLASGMSILDQLLEPPEKGGFGPDAVAIGPGLGLLDGIQAGRWLLERPRTRFHERCEVGLSSLREYRYKWDEESQSFSKKPIHNFASHGADAYRYAAIVMRATEMLVAAAAPKPKAEPGKQLAHYEVTMDELWRIQERGF